MKPQLFTSPQQSAASPEGREQAGSPLQTDFLGSPHQSDCHHRTRLWPVPSPWGTMKPRKTVTTRKMETFRLYVAFTSHSYLEVSREVPCNETLPTLYSL